MITMTGQVTGAPDTVSALQQLHGVLIAQLEQDARASAFQVTRTAQKNYLSGPRPGRLGVITNRLRGSLTEGAPDFILDVQRSTAQITVRVGTNVSYAAIHEYGGTIKPKKGKFLAVPTALAKTPAGALKDQYNRPLRDIPNLFLARSKDKRTLFAAEKTPATGRQRRSGFKVLFWLVRSVTIPARPFLSTALADSVPWITARFQQGIAHVERQITQLLKGR